MLKQAKKKLKNNLKLQFKTANAVELPFKANSFDYSSISLALHDMPIDTGKKVLKEMERVTKKDGRILIVDYMEPAKHKIGKFSHLFVSLYETKFYKLFIRYGLDNIINEAGLDILSRTDFGGFIQIIVSKSKLSA